jgi:hypothetical protein
MWYLPACTSFQTTYVAPQEAVAGQDKIRVKAWENGDSNQVQLLHPWATADSIGGVEECIQICDAYQVWATSLDKVQAVQTLRVDAGRSAAVALGLVVALSIVAVIELGNAFDRGWGR